MNARIDYCRPATVAEAVAALAARPGKARVIGGGTDLNTALRDGRLPEPPERIVDLQAIDALNGIAEDAAGLRIGAATPLAAIAASPVVNRKCEALAAAAASVATPQIRNIATLAGNLCQENRCWYYRYPDRIGGRIDCARKGGDRCYALKGDCRWHSIFGAVAGCVAVNPGDAAPALVVLDAQVVTTRRTMPVADLFAADRGPFATILEADEFIIHVHLPIARDERRSAFTKIAVRPSLDFAVVNCAASLTFSDDTVIAARICLNAVHGVPRRAPEAEDRLLDRPLTPETAAQAARQAVAGARPLPASRYKVSIARDLVEDVVLLAGGTGKSPISPGQ